VILFNRTIGLPSGEYKYFLNIFNSIKTKTMEEFNLDIPVAPSEYVSEFIDLDLFKKVRLTCNSETNGILILEYSTDKVTADIPIEIRLPGNKWISYAVEKKMKYVRYRLKMIEDGKSVKVKFTGDAVPPPPVSTGWFW
jgi:hypothetical protein